MKATIAVMLGVLNAVIIFIINIATPHKDNYLFVYTIEIVIMVIINLYFISLYTRNDEPAGLLKKYGILMGTVIVISAVLLLRDIATSLVFTKEELNIMVQDDLDRFIFFQIRTIAIDLLILSGVFIYRYGLKRLTQKNENQHMDRKEKEK